MHSGAVILLPPSRALRWLRGACPRRRDTAPALRVVAAFGPAARSLRLADDGEQVAAADLIAWLGADLAQRPRLGRGDPVLHLHGLHDHEQLARGDGAP